VLLLARAAIGAVTPPPDCFPANRVSGFVLKDACRYFEFRALSFDTSHQRVEIPCEVVHAGRLRDFFGFNRAKHAIVEAAILATRVAILPREEILAEFSKLSVIVDKTGGPAEREAFDLLGSHVRGRQKSA